MDAGTLNCPSCGAAAPATAVECPFCHTKLATIGCPSCFGRVFIGAKFCDHCGAAIQAPKQEAGVTLKCPRGCGVLQHIALGDAQLDECPVCDGLWVDVPTFERLCSDRERQAPVIAAQHAGGAGASRQVETVRYVPCPECGKLMNRTNFAHSSGVIIDTCKPHGYWFDADELRRVIEFIRAGGLDSERKREIDTLAEERRMKTEREMGVHAIRLDVSDAPAAANRNVDMLSVLVSSFLKRP